MRKGKNLLVAQESSTSLGPSVVPCPPVVSLSSQYPLVISPIVVPPLFLLLVVVVTVVVPSLFHCPAVPVLVLIVAVVISPTIHRTSSGL